MGSPHQPPNRAPAVLWILMVGLAVLAVWLGPQTLIALGPMRESLTAENELTRETALLTVQLVRVALALGAVGVAALIAFWRPVVGSRWVSIWCRHTPPADVSNGGPVLNRSFWISIGAFSASMAYLAFAPVLLADEQLSQLGREDGILEQATAFLFLASAFMSMMLAQKLLRKRRQTDPSAGRRVTWYVLLGLFFFVCFGEEISWGQRIFGFETPEGIKELNVQEETNLHNMMGYFADHLFIIGMLLYGLLLPVLANRYEFWRRSLYWIGLPLASLGLAIGFALASGIHDWTVYAVLPREAHVRAPEIRELLTGLCCALLMIECFVRRRRTATEPLAS